jgi:hypothetical protein
VQRIVPYHIVEKRTLFCIAANLSADRPLRVKTRLAFQQPNVSFGCQVQTLGGKAGLLVRRGGATRRSTSVTPFAPERMGDGAMKRPGAAPRFYAEGWAKLQDDAA